MSVNLQPSACAGNSFVTLTALEVVPSICLACGAVGAGSDGLCGKCHVDNMDMTEAEEGYWETVAESFLDEYDEFLDEYDEFLDDTGPSRS